jgi:hypothetical protein
MTLTSAFQLVPEQSTAALIVHHPEAKYYAVRGAAGGEPASQPSGISQQSSAAATSADSAA